MIIGGNGAVGGRALWTSLIGSFCVLGLLAGCGGGAPPERPTGKVSGKVTFNGKPVTEGTVVFENLKESVTRGAKLGAEGKYHEEKVPALSYSVYIIPKPPENAGGPASSPDGKPVVASAPDIPEKYRLPATSGFTATVKEGATTESTFEMK